MIPTSGNEPSSSVPEGMQRGWPTVFTQFQKDARLWIVIFLSLWMFRWVMILMFRDQSAQAFAATDLLKCAIAGGRFDSVVASYWILPCVLLSVAAGIWGCVRLAERVRLATGILFLVLASVICATAIGFFQEYKDRFNQWIFGAIYDDRVAILKTIWAQYHVVWLLIGLIVGNAIGIILLRRWLREPFASGERIAARFPVWWHRVSLTVVLSLVFFVGLRGSLTARPMLKRDAAATANALLNKMVQNPFVALRFAIMEHLRVTGGKGLEVYLPRSDVADAARRTFPAAAGGATLDDFFLKTALGARGPAPQHIFLVVMESQDAWPMLPRYRALGLGSNLVALAESGLWVQGFISSGESTMKSLAAIITGLPDAGVFTNYQPGSRRPFPTAIAPIFKRLGYKTRFFYGGNLSWERMGEFCEAQGFEEVYGASHITRWGGKAASNWGVKDEYLFRYVAETVQPEQRSFTMIMTTSYHPPFDLDVAAAGFPLREMPAEFKSIYDGKIPMRIYGHYWYADQCLGEFVRTLEHKLNHSVIAITGDHVSRRFLNEQPNLYERLAVPLVLHGPDLLKDAAPTAAMAGSHLDIAPTLVELAAPAGFKYHSMGGNLLDPQRVPVGFGARGTVVGTNFIFQMDQLAKVFPLPGTSSSGDPINASKLKDDYLSFHGLGWWRIMKGAEFPPGKGR